MPEYKVNVKWVTQKYNDILINTDEPPIVFKAQLMTLTDVATERQKVIIKGKILQDEWDGISLTNGQLITMMGQPGEPEPLNFPRLSPPAKKPITVISAADFKALLQNPPKKPREVFGLHNHVNTCYLNAVLQCLWAIPEVCETLSPVESPSIFTDFTLSCMLRNKDSEYSNLIFQMGELFRSGNKISVETNLVKFISILRFCFPRYAELDPETKIFRQHDASELLSDLLNVLKEGLVFKAPRLNERDPISSFFGLKFRSKTFCDDEEFITEESENQLSCFITKEVGCLRSSLEKSFTTSLTIFSEKHQIEREFKRISLLNRLPAYLILQFNRFCYREDTNTNAKILKHVAYDDVLDLYRHCTEELKSRMNPFRSKVEAHGKHVPEDEIPLNFDSEFHDPYWFEDDVGSNCTGMYDLRAVVTHVGRTADSGHYVSWIRESETSWVEVDDINLYRRSFSKVAKLAGGLADWHIAYILIYGPRMIHKQK